MTVDTTIYILRKGSTREECWGRDELVEMFRSGKLELDTKVYLPDQDRWVDASETDFGVMPEPSEEETAERETVRAEYDNAISRLGEEPDSPEIRLEAAQLALELGDREAAREHFQHNLDRHPYHPRTVNEIKRHYGKGEARSFRYLDRPEAVWDNVLDLTSFPLRRGPVYAAVPAVLAAALSFVPFGGLLIAALAYLWCFQIMEYAARGGTRPPDWNRALKDPWRKIVRPALLMGAVWLQWGLLLLAVTALMRYGDGADAKGLVAYFKSSPLLLVLTPVLLIAYLPAAAVSVGGFSRSVAGVIDPRRIVVTIVRLEHEYVYSVLLLFALFVAGVSLCALTSGVPVLRNLVVGIVVAFTVPATGLILGRLLGRNGHVVR